MKRCYRGSYSIVGGIAMVLLSFIAIAFPSNVYAVNSNTVPVPLLTQHLSVPDINGDTGYYDCTIAGVAMVLQTLANQEIVKLSETSTSYDTIRYITRLYYPHVQKGITLREASQLMPILSEGTTQATFSHIDRDAWETVIRRQLANGYPLLVHISDWSYLPNHVYHGKAAHVVIVSGVSEQQVQYVDPWDGKRYSIEKEVFGRAWNTGHYSWRALIFQPTEKATTFSEILRRNGNMTNG